MQPTIGRIVHYTMSKEDAQRASNLAHTATGEGNPHEEGQVLPMVIVRVWGESTVNGQVLLDGNGSLWVTSATEGSGPRTWAWPAIAPVPIPLPELEASSETAPHN